MATTAAEGAKAVASIKARGNAAFAAGDFASAVENYSNAISMCDGLHDPSGVHVLYGNRAAAHLKLRQWAAALADAEAALAVEPKWVKALFRKATALKHLGQPAAASAAAQQAGLIEPGNEDVQTLLQELAVAASQALAAPGHATAVASAPAAGAQVGAGTAKPAPTAALLPPLLAAAPWEYVPAADGVDENLLLLLHGLGDRPAAFAKLARQMALPQTAALALGGPQEVPFSDGGLSWYTVFTEDFELIEGRPGELRRIRSLQQTVAALQQLLAALLRVCGWQAHRVHLLGFSQGGTVALELARQQQSAGEPLGSCVAVSAALLPEQLAQGMSPHSKQDGSNGSSETGKASTAVLLTHGSADNVVSRRAVEETAAGLRQSFGTEVAVHPIPGKGHAMPQGPAEMRRLMEFWAQHLSRRPTAADLPPGAAATSGDLLEVRPGDVSIELLGKRQQ